MTQVYFVSPNGSNSSLGTNEAPWETIQYAIDRVSSQFVNQEIDIVLKAGNYPEELLLNSFSGVASVRIKALTEATPCTVRLVTHNGGSFSVENVKISNNLEYAIHSKADTLYIRDITLQTPGVGIKASGDTKVTTAGSITSDGSSFTHFLLALDDAEISYNSTLLGSGTFNSAFVGLSGSSRVVVYNSVSTNSFSGPRIDLQGGTLNLKTDAALAVDTLPGSFYGTASQGQIFSNRGLIFPTEDITASPESNIFDASLLNTGKLNNARLNPSVTIQGNVFNGPLNLVKLDVAGKLPPLDASQLTNLPLIIPIINASNILEGILPDVRLSANVTLQGNDFNLPTKIVKLDIEGKLPAVDGSLLTNLPSAAPTIDASALTTGTLSNARLTSSVTLAGNTFNSSNNLVRLDALSRLPALNGSLLTDITASSVSASGITGTIDDGRLSSNVTLEGNSFNGSAQLVKTTADGRLPALDGSLLTNLPGTPGGPPADPANLSVTNRTATTLDVASSTGTDATLPPATTSLAGLMSASDKIKLSSESFEPTAPNYTIPDYLTNKFIHYWELNEGGDIADVVTGAYLTSVGDKVVDSLKLIQRKISSRRFSDIDYLVADGTLSQANSNSSFSIIVGIKLSSLPTADDWTILSKGVSSDKCYKIYIQNSTNKIIFQASSNGTTWTSVESTIIAEEEGLYFIHCYYNDSDNEIGISVNEEAVVITSFSSIYGGMAPLIIGAEGIDEISVAGNISFVGISALLNQSEATTIRNSGDWKTFEYKSIVPNNYLIEDVLILKETSFKSNTTTVVGSIPEVGDIWTSAGSFPSPTIFNEKIIGASGLAVASYNLQDNDYSLSFEIHSPTITGQTTRAYFRTTQSLTNAFVIESSEEELRLIFKEGSTETLLEVTDHFFNASPITVEVFCSPYSFKILVDGGLFYRTTATSENLFSVNTWVAFGSSNQEGGISKVQVLKAVTIKELTDASNANQKYYLLENFNYLDGENLTNKIPQIGKVWSDTISSETGSLTIENRKLVNESGQPKRLFTYIGEEEYDVSLSFNLTAPVGGSLGFLFVVKGNAPSTTGSSRYIAVEIIGTSLNLLFFNAGSPATVGTSTVDIGEVNTIKASVRANTTLIYFNRILVIQYDHTTDTVWRLNTKHLGIYIAPTNKISVNSITAQPPSSYLYIPFEGNTVEESILPPTVTTQGNTFNAADKLLRITSDNKLPAIDGSNLTDLNGSSISSGTLNPSRLPSQVTLKGNTFNVASSLVELDSTGRLPALDGSLLTNLPVSSPSIDASDITSGTLNNARLSSQVTLQGNDVNTPSNLIRLDGAGRIPSLDGSQITSLTKDQVGLSNVPNVDTSDASNISTGTLNQSRLPSSVTTEGNTFNGNSQLVKTTSDGKLPVLDGSLLTNVATILTFEAVITSDLTISTGFPNRRFIDGGTSDFNITLDLPDESEVWIFNIGSTNDLILFEGITPIYTLIPGKVCIATKSPTQLYITTF